MQDILYDSNNDFEISNGDFRTGESDYQHIQDLLYASKGDFRQFPQRGVGLLSYLDDDKAEDLGDEILKELKADGATVESFQLESASKFNIKARYD